MQSSKKSPEERAGWLGLSFALRVWLGIIITAVLHKIFHISETRAFIIGFTLAFFPKLLLLIIKATGKLSLNILEKGLYLVASLASSTVTALSNILKRIFKK